MEQLRGPVIVLDNSSHGFALRDLSSDQIKSIGSSVVLHPDGQIDIHGTPSEEDTFNLRGHWLEGHRNNILLLDPPRRPESLQWDPLSWRCIISGWVGCDVIFSHGNTLKPGLMISAQHIIKFGEVLIACYRDRRTGVYDLKDTRIFDYGWPSGLLTREIPIGNPSPVPISP